MPEVSSSDERIEKRQITTKKLAACRQIEAAIAHFWVDEYECAITLSAAAEGLMPATDEPHIFSILRASPLYQAYDLNAFINWLKHPTGPARATISEFEAVITIVRATSKYAAVYNEMTNEMKYFGRWAFSQGHVPTPREMER